MKDLNHLPLAFMEAIKQDRLFQIALVVAVLFVVAAVRQINQANTSTTTTAQPSQPTQAVQQPQAGSLFSGQTPPPAPVVTQPQQQASTGQLFTPQQQGAQGAAPAPPAIKEVKPGQSLEALGAAETKKSDDNFARAKKAEEPQKVEVVK